MLKAPKAVLIAVCATAILLIAAGQSHSQQTALAHTKSKPVKPTGELGERAYWLNKSKTLSITDARYRRAQSIFEHVVAAADRRAGPEPELIVLDESGYPWARSLSDGTIMLTRGAIDICFKTPSRADGNARLAFILGHELSHQVNGDFWHFFFYQGIHSESVRDPQARATLDRVRNIAKSGDSVAEKELRADQYGFLYASQAGFNVRRIVDHDTNFFREWVAATNPGMLEGVVMQSSHPRIEERAAAVLVSLQNVIEQLKIFDMGVAEYRAGQYSVAMSHFEDFLTIYQSREAYNNLGLTYYKLAEVEKIKWRRIEPGFQLSLIIDPISRARKTLMGKKRKSRSLMRRSMMTMESDSLFNRYSKQAIRYFKEASRRDPSYAMAHNNLACVYFLTGEYSVAVGELDRALALDANLTEAMNNRALGYLKMGQKLRIDLTKNAEADLKRAMELNPGYQEAIFNLAFLYKMKGNRKKLKQYREMFIKRSPHSELSVLLR